jgi:hypothetical protein
MLQQGKQAIKNTKLLGTAAAGAAVAAMSTTNNNNDSGTKGPNGMTGCTIA